MVSKTYKEKVFACRIDGLTSSPTTPEAVLDGLHLLSTSMPRLSEGMVLMASYENFDGWNVYDTHEEILSKNTPRTLKSAFTAAAKKKQAMVELPRYAREQANNVMSYFGLSSRAEAIEMALVVKERARYARGTYWQPVKKR